MSDLSSQSLDEAGLRRLLHCVRQLSRLDQVDDFHPHAVSVLRGLVDDEWIASETYDADSLVWKSGIVDPLIPGGLYDVFIQRAAENPILAKLTSGEKLDPVMTWATALQDAKAHEALPIWHDFYSKLDIQQQAAAFQILPDGTILSHAFSRNGMYSHMDIAMIEMIRPHLTNAYLTWRSFQQIRMEPLWLLDGLEAMESALILINTQGKVLRWTPRAERLLEIYFSTSRKGRGCLPGKLSRWIAAVLANDPSQFVAPPPYSCTKDDGESVLQIRLIRQEKYNAFLLILNERHAVPKPRELQAKFGLTPQRARVLNLLAKGLDNKAIAQKLGLSPGTIRKHLEYVYHTLNVSSRAEAIARIWQD